MIQDVERDAGRSLHGGHDRPAVGGAPEQLGPHEGDLPGAESPGPLGIAGELGHELAPERLRDRSVLLDGVAEPDEHRLVGQRVEAMARNPGDER